MPISLSILDQSPISRGMSATQALQQTAQLARKAEEWGYQRFWVSEHHDATTLAGSSPEILISHLGAVTNTIRLGSGGVMLPHYSAYKIAENFKLLEALYPGRIDAGVGRAPGGMPRATYALHEGGYRDVHRFPQQVDELRMYLNDAIPEDHPYYGLKATPVTEAAPPVWMLGSSPNSAMLAAEKGLPYMYAQFINGEDGIRAAKYYRDRFKPHAGSKPQQGVAVFVSCQETEEQAERMASSLDLSMVLLEQGKPSNGTPSPEEAMSYAYTSYERNRIEDNRRRMLVGTPEQVADRIGEIAAAHGAEEVMLVTIAYDFEDKLKSFRLVAEEMKKRQ
ncbi:LLM class flavin-dependent oxidoreductase [Planococcus lenghuensis]|uniref:Luciferase family oxidoreductase n=1 Tax=Planococcus lenghuensis TaxID=2213202 RepID=A0A1Q2KX99_9BACL|nr:LLM class flavin-dependent oxidoreductase [Planococcus lenghuensis]AQQ52756.1 luciferase family oxidoreductase [Planococcus lenghuensis]